MSKNDNPFYDNHVFTKEDISRAKIRWQDRLWLWVYPTLVQMTDDGVVYYKNVNGAYYILKWETYPHRQIMNQIIDNQVLSSNVILKSKE